MYGVWDDASVGVGWKEGVWVIVVVVVYIIPTVVAIIIVGMYQLSWQGRIRTHEIRFGDCHLTLSP